MTTYRLTHCGSCDITDDEQRTAEHAAREYCDAHGINIDAVYAASFAEADTLATDTPAGDIWGAIERAAILAATDGWYRVPGDLSFGPG